MALAVIPSRFHSTRFDGKPLARVGSEALVARVARRVLESGVVSQVLVATDDRRIAAAVAHLDVQVRVDPPGHPFACGTDRVAAAAEGYPHQRIINVQGDEALVDSAALAAALRAMEGNDMGTVASSAAHPSELTSGDVVKVDVDPRTGRALDFSRRQRPRDTLAHVGLYAFWRHSLERFASLAPSPREQAEGLEQLRALEAGMSIGVGVVTSPHIGINRPADLDTLARIRGAEPATKYAAPETGLRNEASRRSM